MKNETERNLEVEEQVQRNVAGKKISVNSKIIVGQPVGVIVKDAKKANVDLIIVGSIALGGISHIRALGSVSRGGKQKGSLSSNDCAVARAGDGSVCNSGE